MNLAVLKTLGNGQVAKAAYKTAFVIRKYSPEILTTVGIAGTVTAAVLGAKATLHLEPIVDNVKLRKELAETRKHNETAEEYSSVEHQKTVTKIYFDAAGQVAKLYAPALILGTVSIGCIVGGHGVMHKRNIAMVAAYKGLEESFQKYRSRVAEEIGESKAKDIEYGLKNETVKGDDGKNHTVKVVDKDAEKIGVYFFDSNNKNWHQSPDYNLSWLRGIENMANQRLTAQGYLFLNNVLKDLGFEETAAGAVTGWISPERGEDADGDGYVDFGMVDMQGLHSRTFGTDDTDAVLLNFNIDGPILHHLPQK